MSSAFLEEQAKARGITVSQMMSERSKKANPKKRGFAVISPKRKAEIDALAIEARQAKRGLE